MKTGFPKVLEQLDRAGGGLTDGQLLARFVAARDEPSFASLLRRHGPMVLGVCRRVLRDFHDAEDAFQATFLILARKAPSVVKHESVGCWLYAVAYNTALEAARANALRRARERQARNMPQPEASLSGVPAELADLTPLLDREVNRLSERYRSAVVLCDLEGHPRKEAARLLGVPEGTLSSRLTRARMLLAKRLAGRGLALSAGTLAAAVMAEAASAQVPAALMNSTARVATLVAAGQLAAASTPAAVLMKGVMKAMLLKKLRLVVGAVMVAMALAAVGFISRPGDEARAQSRADERPRARQPAPERGEGGKPLTEIEALRRENEELKINVRVLLKEIAALEAELNGLRDRPAGDRSVPGGKFRPPSGVPDGGQPDRGGPGRGPGGDRLPGGPRPGGPEPGVGPGGPGSGRGGDRGPFGPGDARPRPGNERPGPDHGGPGPGGRPEERGRPLGRDAEGDLSGITEFNREGVSSAANEVEAALKELREARELRSRQRAVQSLENALKKLQDQLTNPGSEGVR
jgi:RNA polymerase sigma factor (sigma-70 family)